VRHEPGLAETRFILIPHVDTILHLLARLEGYDKLLWNMNLVARLGISGFTGCTLFDFEHTKIAKLDSSLVDQSVNDRIESFLSSEIVRTISFFVMGTPLI